MKKLIFFTAIVFLALKSNAQNFITREDSSPVYNKVDTDPIYPGGFAAFDRYIDDNAARILKPDHALGVVAIRFLVDKDGRVTAAEVIKGLSPETDSAAVYLVKNSPLWKPGIKNGFAVNTLVKIGVKFRYSGKLQPVHVADVKVSKGVYADVTIDEPVGGGSSNSEGDPNRIYTSVEQTPEFPGGITQFFKYIKDNQKIKTNADEGTKRVIVSFVVERNGSLTGIKVVRSVSADCDAEALRLIKQSPKWRPGLMGGKPVRTAYMIPVVYGEN